MTKINSRQSSILKLMSQHTELSSSDVKELLNDSVGLVTIKRDLSKLLDLGFIEKMGGGRSTTYKLTIASKIMQPIDLDEYYAVDIEERNVFDHFRLEVISQDLLRLKIFTKEETKLLDDKAALFQANTADLSPTIYAKEMERLGIDLSWKSSQIEGNTYSLLETELLLKEQIEAVGKPKADATMLLNHKSALDFIIENPDYIEPISISKIENIHSLLIKDLGVGPNIRKRLVGITGTKYRPLDNEHQIREALSQVCDLINSKNSVFEKALLALLLISYIQPFEDGNKRTARIVSNAILISSQTCPLSYRSINSIDYKKAMLLFYEQNNLFPFKKLFIEQYEFVVNNYFG